MTLSRRLEKPFLGYAAQESQYTAVLCRKKLLEAGLVRRMSESRADRDCSVVQRVHLVINDSQYCPRPYQVFCSSRQQYSCLGCRARWGMNSYSRSRLR